MGDIQAGENLNLYMMAGITILFCVIVHFVYNIVFKSKKKEALQQVESDTGKFCAARIQE